MHTATLITFLASVVSATPYGHRFDTRAETCPVVFDGRVPSNASLTDFDKENGGGWNPYNPGFVKGNNITWSEILKLPKTKTSSRFDTAEGSLPLEVTISDESIFMKQLGFRRAGLQFSKDTNEGSPGAKGVKTLHFSIMQDASRPLNLSHEYLNVWHEKADFSGNQFQFQTGTLIGQKLKADTWKLLDQQNKLLWETPMVKGKWQNFAITLDYEKNTIQMYYSEGCKRLKAATELISRDLSGQGQYQIGILKKPTGTDDVANAGFQEKNLNEGLIYGGIFVEDSKSGCVSL
ncbi:Endoglucanase c [Fusarium acuminatum]|uniref:Endoglucanase c n=1 Tax=Fusarium acuminatum TaxID=5515 RepID=A0ABZ2X8C0_9HYPO